MTVRIEEMFAFIALDPADDTEGVTAALRPNGEWMPMIGADMDRMNSLRPVAREIAKASGQRVTLCRFTTREELEAFDG